MFTYLALLILYTIDCTLPMPLGHRSSIYLYVHILIHPFRFVCITVGSYWAIVKLLVRYYSAVGTRSTSIATLALTSANHVYLTNKM